MNKTNGRSYIPIFVALIAFAGIALGAIYVLSNQDTPKSANEADSPTNLQRPVEGLQNLLVIISKDSLLSNFYKNLTESGVSTALENSEMYTVFAPDNQAFFNIQGEASTQDKIQGILQSHIVWGFFPPESLTDGQEITTLNGNVITVRIINGEINLELNDLVSKVVSTGVEASNGVVYKVDTILSN